MPRLCKAYATGKSIIGVLQFSFSRQGAGAAASKRRNSHMCCHEFCQHVAHHSEDLAVLFIGMPLGCLTVSCVPHGNRAGLRGGGCPGGPSNGGGADLHQPLHHISSPERRRWPPMLPPPFPLALALSSSGSLRSKNP
ncbi:uncharacterized protein [Miscanthus floridulus]|uniref:uncharacterized protein n=1 Tax=Miscanthus floridulus TaxID=154761 RepID=UPI00345B167D